MHRRKTVLPGVGLGEVVVDLPGLEARHEVAVVAWTHQPCSGIKQTNPSLAASPKFLRRPEVAQARRSPRNRRVVVAVLQRLGNAFGLVLNAQVSVRGVGRQAKNRRVGGGCHGVEQSSSVYRVALSVGIGEHAYAVVADHAVGFVAGKFPNRQTPRLIKHIQHADNKVFGSFWLN